MSELNITIDGGTSKRLLTAGKMCDKNILVTATGGGGEDLPEEAFLFEGLVSYACAYDNWSWFINLYGDKISTDSLGECNHMFVSARNIEDIPFDFNCANNTYHAFNCMFQYCDSLKNIGKIINAYPTNINYMFDGCYMLRYLPEFENVNFDRLCTYQYSSTSNMFKNCYSLREIPESLLKELYNPSITMATYYIVYGGFTRCYALNEIREINPQTGTMTGNLFISSFNFCSRLKNIIFALQDDGTPYTAKWKSQIIDLDANVGYAANISHILNYNSGITADKEVKDDASYQALKNDEDWFTCDIAYSRYNHDSAVNTINSLPDTSAYLASAGGTNTIKFKGTAGSLTDGGAINTLTEEEIAVATAKGWTVTLV